MNSTKLCDSNPSKWAMVRLFLSFKNVKHAQIKKYISVKCSEIGLAGW